MYILGIWDGHDSGSALINDDRILFASNEERYTKRKLEVAFPYNSIKAAISYAGIKPSDISLVAFPTTEITKTVSRIFPFQKEAYYRFRRRKIQKPLLEPLMHISKYSMTSIGPLPGCRFISTHVISKQLASMGIRAKIVAVDHHSAHAASAAFTSGFSKAMVITLDGVGDGLSASVSTLSKGALVRHHKISARNSIGIFYEQVTNILGMRELEDEGKIMAMADYSYPFELMDNKLKDFFTTKGIDISARYGPVSQYRRLSRLAWSIPREQFAYMAQQVLEEVVVKLFSEAATKFGMRDLAYAGGVASNIKANMKIRRLESTRNLYVFPHMGDGGIALGAAMYANYVDNGTSSYEFSNAYLGRDYKEEEVERELKRHKWIRYEKEKDAPGHAAELIGKGNYILWFNGRMEYGPRALGNRSILARPDSQKVKDMLNISVKKREWYQPFAPSILEGEAERLFEEVKCRDRFMTMAYAVREECRSHMESVMHVDSTARPQMVGRENEDYSRLIKKLKESTGYGVVLNTSFNIHGMPIAESPEDALNTMRATGSKYLFINGYLIQNKEGKK
jgi:carbamoyltransferase